MKAMKVMKAMAPKKTMKATKVTPMKAMKATKAKKGKGKGGGNGAVKGNIRIAVDVARDCGNTIFVDCKASDSIKCVKTKIRQKVRSLRGHDYLVILRGSAVPFDENAEEDSQEDSQESESCNRITGSPRHHRNPWAIKNEKVEESDNDQSPCGIRAWVDTEEACTNTPAAENPRTPPREEAARLRARRRQIVSASAARLASCN